MRALTLLIVLALAGCEGRSMGGRDFVSIPRAGAKKAADFEEAQRRASAWCRKQGHAEAVEDDDGDVRYFRFACR